MKSFLNLILVVPFLTFTISCNAQMKNVKTVNVKIDGNCEMCEETIETAAYLKKTASADWNKDTKQAILSFDSTKTNADEVLKRIAYSGYDNEKFLAPDDAYAKLPGCCKYDRKRKKMSQADTVVNNTIIPEDTVAIVQVDSINPFKTSFDSYFELKNALVKTDSKTAGQKATDLVNALSQVDMSKLENSQHIVWMKLYKGLIAEAETISKSKDIVVQRNHFMILSDNMYELAKVAKLKSVVYYQNCPMYNDGKGANWLSQENTVKNPYYGSQMLTCGKTIETIK